MRRILIAAAVITTALALQAPTALATCYSSTPSNQTFTDTIGDGDAGLAPELIGVVTSLNDSCSLTVDPMILGDTEPGDLISDESVGIYIDTDGNPNTGSSTWKGADEAIITVGEIGDDLPPGLGTWNGTTFTFTNAPSLAPTDTAGFTAALDTLGITTPTTLGIRTIAIYNGVYDTYGDFAPEVTAPSFAFPVAFSTTAPTPAPTPPAPAAATPLAPAPSTSKAGSPSQACRVPAVRSLTQAHALKRIRNAGCRYQIVRVASHRARGTVVSQAPAGGRVTSNPVVLAVSRGHSAAHRRTIGTADLYAAAERTLESTR